MSDRQLFGFDNFTESHAESSMEFISHHLVGGNPADPAHGYWNSKEDAFINFTNQFIELAEKAHGNFLFVRRAPMLTKEIDKFKVVGRFSIAKLREKNHGDQ